MSYHSGDYYVLCARCGCKKLRSEVILDNSSGKQTGLPDILVCPEHYDGIHPQSKPTPVRQDPRALPSNSVRTETIAFNIHGIWEDLNIKWEDMDCKWEDYKDNYTYESVADEL